MAKFERGSKSQNIALAVGMLLLIFGIALFFIPPFAELEKYHFFLNLGFVLICWVLLFFSVLMRRVACLYVSVNLCIFSLIMLILTARSVPFKQFWPLLVVSSGITLIPIGWIHYKRLRMVYVISSSALTILGIFFFLFTFKVIKEPMRVFFKQFLPIFLMICGALLIVLYYIRQNNKDKFPLIDDDSISDEI